MDTDQHGLKKKIGMNALVRVERLIPGEENVIELARGEDACSRTD